MDFEDLTESFDAGVFWLLVPLGVLCGAVLVRRAATRFQRISEQYVGNVSACGLTGEQVARRLLAVCGLSDVAVVSTNSRDIYHPVKREVRLTPVNYSGRSLTALATAAHEAGHAQQFASQRFRYGLRRTCREFCQILGIGALLLLLGAIWLPVRNLGSVLFVMCALAVVLQAVMTLPHERDASHRARELVRQAGLIAPGEEVGFDRLLNAAWLTYAAAEAQRGISLLLIGVLTIVGFWERIPALAPARFDGLAMASQSTGEGGSMASLPGLLIAARLLPLAVIGVVLLRRLRRNPRRRPARAERAAERNNAALASYT